MIMLKWYTILRLMYKTATAWTTGKIKEVDDLCTLKHFMVWQEMGIVLGDRVHHRGHESVSI